MDHGPTENGAAAPALQPQFKYGNGAIYNADCVEFLKQLPGGSADLVIADPPYNIKKAEWDNIGSIDEYVSWSMSWIAECHRVLKDGGTMYVCGFTEILADIKRPAMTLFDRCRWLIWYYENKANLSNDWGRSHESLLCLRKGRTFTFNIDQVRIPYNAHTLKYPQRAMNGENSQYSTGKNNSPWTPNPLGAKPKDVISVPTTCNGMKEKTPHPTQKPEELIRKLCLASSNENEVVVDPFSGSGTTAVVATQLNRRFVVNDRDGEYNRLADERLANVDWKSVAEWIEFDKANEKRRRSLQ